MVYGTVSEREIAARHYSLACHCWINTSSCSHPPRFESRWSRITQVGWWWLESFSVVTLLYFKYFQLWQCCMTHRTCTLAYFNLLALRTIILVFYSQSFVDDVDSWSSNSNPTHHNNSQALPQTAWETNVASDHECMSAVSALTMDIVVKSGKGLEAWDGSWNGKLFKVCVHIR